MLGISKWRLALAVPAILLGGIGLINQVSYMADTARLGGTAANGYVRDGHYVVAEHGVIHEVSREDWERNDLQGKYISASTLLGIVGFGYLLLGVVSPYLIGRASPDAAARVQSVRTSGPRLADTWTGGQLGPVRFKGPLMRVAVHQGGIVIRPIIMGPRAILAREIVAVEPKKELFASLFSIEHVSADVASPVVLAVSEDSAVGEAIQGIAKRGSAGQGGSAGRRQRR
jgi:hypothetical protein